MRLNKKNMGWRIWARPVVPGRDMALGGEVIPGPTLPICLRGLMEQGGARGPVGPPWTFVDFMFKEHLRRGFKLTLPLAQAAGSTV